MVIRISAHRNDDEAIEDRQVANDPEDGRLLCTHYVCGLNEFRRAAKLVRVPVAVTIAVASPRRTRAPANVSVPEPASMGRDSP